MAASYVSLARSLHQYCFQCKYATVICCKIYFFTNYCHLQF